MGDVEVSSSGESITLAVGDRAVVVIPENASTGYQWEVDSLPDHLALEGSEFVPPGGQPAPGAGGQRRVVLRARGPGRGTVVLALRRPWERGAAPDERFELQVSVP